MEIYIVDAFTGDLFCGNPAGVVLLGDGEGFPDGDTMLRVAAELRYSETAFVKRLGGGQYHTRYFTPVAEIDLCGHATIAAFHVLHTRGEARGCCRNLTAAGNLRVIRHGGIFYMEMAAPVFVGAIESREAICALYHAVGLESCGLPAWIISTGLPDILLPVSDVAELFAISPDFPALAAISERHGAVGVHAFAPMADDGRIHCRNFAPRYGIEEEAATGTANGALTWYLRRRGLIGDGAHTLFVQGETMGRPSVIHSRIEGGESVWIGGEAAVLASGRLSPEVAGDEHRISM